MKHKLSVMVTVTMLAFTVGMSLSVKGLLREVMAAESQDKAQNDAQTEAQKSLNSQLDAIEKQGQILANSQLEGIEDSVKMPKQLRDITSGMFVNMSSLTDPLMLQEHVAETSEIQDLQPRKVTEKVVKRLQGKASWYGPGFHGRRSASGEKYNQHDLTAAHRTLPFGTKVRVVNLKNGRSTIVRINDRGPFHRSRIIDVSAGAARALGMIRKGVAPVKLEVLARGR